MVVCRTRKPEERRGRILFINAVNEVTRERAQSFLTDEHIERIVGAYRAFSDEAGFAYVATLPEIRASDGNLSIPLYVAQPAAMVCEEPAQYGEASLPDALSAWLESSRNARKTLYTILSTEYEKKPHDRGGRDAGQ
ncbi:N-6 DNA Methylase [anaerobic digester metagenome]